VIRSGGAQKVPWYFNKFKDPTYDAVLVGMSRNQATRTSINLHKVAWFSGLG